MPGLSIQVIQDLADANVHIDSVKEAIKEGFVEGAEIQKLNGVINLYDLFRQKVKELKYIAPMPMFIIWLLHAYRTRNFLKTLNIFWRMDSMILPVLNRIFLVRFLSLILQYYFCLTKETSILWICKTLFESFVLGLARDVAELPQLGFSCLMNSQLEDNTQYLANMYVINASGKGTKYGLSLRRYFN